MHGQILLALCSPFPEYHVKDEASWGRCPSEVTSAMEPEATKEPGELWDLAKLSGMTDSLKIGYMYIGIQVKHFQNWLPKHSQTWL